MDTTDLILHSSPFSTTSDPRFFYTNARYEEGYKRLLTALRERKGLLLLTGEPGTGKTTFLHRFSAALDETAHVTFLPCAAPTFQEILSYLCEQCGLPRTGDDQWTQLALFQEYLQEQETRGGIEALFIDEAQHLNKETLDRLRLLMNRDGQNGKLLQIILAGHPELEDKLAQPELRHIQQRIAASCRLLPLVREELGSFIQHRLRIAGYPQLEIFAPEAMQAITHYAGGIPRLINVICDAALLTAARRGLDSVSEEIIVHVAHTLQLTPFPDPQPFCEPTPQMAHSLPVSFGPEPEAPSDTTPLLLAEEVHRKRTLATQTTLSQSTRTRRRFSFFVPSLPHHAMGISLSAILVGLSPLLLPSDIEQIDIPSKETLLETNLLPALQEPTPIRDHAAITSYVAPSSVQTMKPLAIFPEIVSPSLSLAITPLFIQSAETHALASAQQQGEQLPVPIAPTSSSPQSPVTQQSEAPQKQGAPLAAASPIHEPDPHVSDTQRQPSRLPDVHSGAVVEPLFSSPQLPPKVSAAAPFPLVLGPLSRRPERTQTATRVLAPSWSFLRKAEARARLASLGLTANPAALLRAADNSSLETVDLMLRAGVSPNTQNVRGWTPLMLAVRGGSLDLVEMLLARGAQPNMKNETGATALLVAARHNRPAIAQALLRRGAMINATDRQGWTALMYAASLGYSVTVRTLLNSGADPRLVNKEGWTASTYAAQGQRAAVAPSQTAFHISEHRNRFGQQHQRMVGEQDFGEILALLKQAEEKPYSQRHRMARSSIARF